MTFSRSALCSLVFFTSSLLMCSVITHAQETAPLSPEEAAQKFTLPDGFQATLFAGEPDVQQPIGFSFDDRGRLWVVECFSYPEWSDKKQDRVLIFEDTDHDGKFDSRKVFWDQGVNLSGIEVGFGGVWLCSTPNLIFIPDANQDDKPDAEPTIVLDGWDAKTSRHNVFNGLTWGVDGWLYGLNGILSKSFVGKPGTPENQRTKLDCGVWRYHPTKQIFEAVAHGSTNPWGLDFDQYGQAFITNCVIEHLWHVIPGAHYKRMFGQDVVPNTYELMPSIVDYIHWGGGNWTSSREGKGKHDAAGGGHAHAGAMVYLGDNWPDKYRQTLFTLNIHGRRANNDVLEQHASRYSVQRGDDMIFSRDPWFRGLELKYGPDGGVFITDWNDTGECHDYVNTQKKTGRIFKVTYGTPTTETVKLQNSTLQSLTNDELVKLHTHKNEWYVRHARRILQERLSKSQLQSKDNSKQDIAQQLWSLFEQQDSIPQKLRALWTLHALDSLSEQQTMQLLTHNEEWIRAWAVRLELDDKHVSTTILANLIRLSQTEQSPRVRLELASALQRMNRPYRWLIANNLVTHEEDQHDKYIPLMLWYGLSEAIDTHPPKGIKLLKKTRIPKLRQLIARHLAHEPALYELLANSLYDEVRLDLLTGIRTALLGQKQVSKPAAWEQVRQNHATSSNASIRLFTQLLSLQFGQSEAPAQLRELIANKAEPTDSRTIAITALTQQQDKELVPLLLSLLLESELSGTALTSLAAFDDQQIPVQIIENFSKLSLNDQQKAVGTLCSRPNYALAMLTAMEAKTFPRNSLSAFHARQLISSNNQEVTQMLEKVWGKIGQTDEAKKKLQENMKKLLTPDNISNADPVRGRLQFKKSCASCHKMFGEGSKVGPELTGSQRSNVDYLIQNIVDPNALVGKDFQMTTFVTSEGRVVSGIIVSEENEIITIQTPTEQLKLNQEDIDDQKTSPLSLMPEGLLKQLEEQQILDLIAYLQSPQQVALPKEQPADQAETK